jgi:hypothetical protein
VLSSGQKLTLGLLTTITLEVVPFHVYAPFLALLPFFKCMAEVVFCESIQHCLRFCLDHLNSVKMAAFQFQSSIGETENWVGITVMLFLVKKSLVKRKV